jgi:hypothetical protein
MLSYSEKNVEMHVRLILIDPVMPSHLIPMTYQRSLLPLVGVVLQCLDENQSPIENAFASGFIRREEGHLYLYTCWHVVTGFDPADVRIPLDHPTRRYLKVALQGSTIYPDYQTISGLQTFILPLYEKGEFDGGRSSVWLQDDHHVPHSLLNDNGIFVPFWHDLVKIPLPSDLTISDVQVIGPEQTVSELGIDLGPGAKCLIVGFPYGFSTAGPEQPTPIVLTRFLAGSRGRMHLLLESIGAPGMSGSPVFIETADQLLLFGIYTGCVFPDHMNRDRQNVTALGTVSDLQRILRGPLRLTTMPSILVAPKD